VPSSRALRRQVDELTTELRHKYLTILKSCYWEFFEEGQCMPDSVIVLMESADRAMDHEEDAMQDWEFIRSYIMSESFVRLMSGLSQLPCVGRVFKAFLFDHFTLSYDILVSFIDGHDAATKMIDMVIENKDFVGKILLESGRNVHGAEGYMHRHIEDTFPEICKAIQHRRAQYYLLVHEYHYVDKMLKNG
jgi:hypothetical protein